MFFLTRLYKNTLKMYLFSISNSDCLALFLKIFYSEFILFCLLFKYSKIIKNKKYMVCVLFNGISMVFVFSFKF